MKWILFVLVMQGSQSNGYATIWPTGDDCKRQAELITRQAHNGGDTIGDLACIPYQRDQVMHFHFHVDGDWQQGVAGQPQ